MSEFILHTTRMSSHFKKATESISDDVARMRGNIVLTYCDDGPIDVSINQDDQFFRLIRRCVRNPYADKGRINKILHSQGVKGLFPITCATIEEAKKHTDVKLWFAKSRHGTAGKNMECLLASDLEHYNLPKLFVLQAGVSDLALIDGCKFTLRIYMLIWNGQAYLYNEGFNMIHGAPYAPDSTDYDVQINHVGYMDLESSVKIQKISEFHDYEKVWPIIEEKAEKLTPGLTQLLNGSSHSEYVLLGIDCMLQEPSPGEYDLKMIEINVAPNFVHTKKINNELNIPFFIASIRTMLGLKTESLSKLNHNKQIPLTSAINKNITATTKKTHKKKATTTSIPLKIPDTGKTLNTEPLIHVIDDIISAEEASHIIKTAEPYMKRAVVSSATEGVESPGRTGAVHWVRHNTTPMIEQIVDRISNIIGIPKSHAESLQVIYYGETQQYKPHFDAYDLSTEKGMRCTASGGQRLVTALMYLNTPKAGGGTTFPKAKQQVDAKTGRLVIFHNCYEGTNTRHPHSLHGGLPVESGEKWACNLWYRERAK